MAALTQLLRDPLSQIAVAIAVLLLVMQGLGVAVFGTELGTSNLPLIPLLVVGILCFELSRRACEPGPERRFWLLLGFSQVMWLLAELVYLLPIPETGEVAVELANDALLAVVYIGVILALQSTPHEEREVSESPHPGPAWQTLGTLLFVAALFLYFSLIPIYFNPDLYVSLVPSTLLFVVLDLYLIAALLLLLRQTSSLRWISVYTAVLIAEIVWVAADTGEGLVYLGVLSSTAPWASLASTVGLLAKIGAARVARASFSETVRPEDASKARLHLAAWDGQLVVFALFLPILHVAFASLGFTDEATRGPREVLVMASILVFGGLAFANHRALEKSNRRLEDRYRDAQKQLVEKQLETVALREHERAEKAILHTQRLESLGVLAGGIAHDFNNLLAAIMGNADLALHKLPGDAPARRYVDEVMAASERATALTGQMLSYAGRGRYDVRRLDLNVVVREIAPLMHSSNSRNARLELEPGLPAIAADAAQLQQLVMNLVTNASDAIGDEPGTITVRTGVAVAHHGAPAVFLTVTDTGCGFGEDTRARMFDPFFSTKSEGRGLGLSAVDGIVRGHQGSLSVESAPGAGSTFRVVLPACAGEVDAQVCEAGTERQEAPSRGTVLVIDDEEAVRKLAAAILGADGWEVVTAADGLEGIEEFRRHTGVCAVVLDLTMPGRAGAKVFGDLRRLRPTIPVVLISGYTEADVSSFLDGEECVRFVKKPFRSTAIREALQAVTSAEADVPPGPWTTG